MKHTMNLQHSASFTPTSGCSPDRAKQRASVNRRGVAVVLVLGMLAMTLALAYASLRGQSTIAKLADNLGRGEEARVAAESGVYVAMRRMSEATWAGVGTSFSSNITSDSWYEVSFATGDPQL